MTNEYLNPSQTASSERTKRTHVTVTHPNHPLNGLKLEVVRGSRNPASTLIVKISDDSTLRICKEWTDYDDSPDEEKEPDPSHLCSVEGLKQLALMLDATSVSEEPHIEDRQ
jgi:hypothetical protein